MENENHISEAEEFVELESIDYFICYKTTCLETGKFYVGQHIQHNTSAFDGYFGSGKIIKHSVIKYGEENHIRETLEFCSSSISLNEREIYWISALSANVISYPELLGMNISYGGEGRSGYKHSEESKIKMSEVKLGKKLSQETKDKIRKAVSGENNSMKDPKNREKVSRALKGKIVKQETRKKLSQANLGKCLSDETKEKISKQLKIVLNNSEYKEKVSLQTRGSNNPSCKYLYELSNGEDFHSFFSKNERIWIRKLFRNLKNNEDNLLFKNILIKRKNKEV